MANQISISFDEINSECDKSDNILIIDFLNLIRTEICHRSDAKFKTIDELIEGIRMIAKTIRNTNNFEKIYLVTKSFIFNKEILYNDIPKIIMWTFCREIPDKLDKIYLVLVNGMNDKDKEADDRALFILYNEMLFTGSNITILSNDRFDNIQSHYLRKVTLKFYWIKSIGETWQTSEIYYSKKAIFQQNKKRNNEYNVIHPNTGIRSIIHVS